MPKEIDALETLDEYSDEEYSAYLEYKDLKDRCMIDPTTLYIDNNHEFFSEWKYFAETDGLEIKIINGETRIC
mgnify:FL=1|jgi:hypothetical protein|tara:strand:+ start:326 stop:544 length:219 start_codon:yes stop_codon:yes gene_type:complete